MDLMSDVEIVDIMLGSYSRDGEGDQGSENEVNLDSGSSRPQRTSNLVGQDFRSLLNTNRRENSENTIETIRKISEEISNQMSRKLNEIKASLNYQIQDAFNNAIAEKVLPSIQNTIEARGRVNQAMVDCGSDGLQDSSRTTNFTMADRRSSGLQRNSELENAQKSCDNRPRKYFRQGNSRQMSRQSSVDSYSSEQNRDRCLS